MTTFTIITGLATLIGFFLQIKDLLPNYRRYYFAATFFLLGLTLGFGLTSATQVSVNLPATLSPKNIIGFALFGGAGLLIVLCFTAAALVSDPKRRVEVSRIGSAVSGFLIFLLVFFSSSFFPAQPHEQPNYLTYDEQIEVAMSAAKRQSFDRAILLLTDAMRGLTTADSRRENLQKAIDDFRTQQATLPTSTLQPTPK